VDSGAGRLDESVFHRIDRGTLCTLPILEDKVEGYRTVVATDAYKRILEIVYIRKSKFVGKKTWIPVARLSVNTTVSR